MLKLGLDVHLQFIMAVVQRGHLGPQAPRKFTRPELVEQVKGWCAEGLQVFAVQESCGFGFVLHRQLLDVGAQSFLITPVVLNGKRKTDKVDAARCACGSRVGWKAMARNWPLFASLPWRNNAGAKPPAADSSSNGRFAPWPIAAMGKWPSIAMKSFPIAGGALVIGKNFPRHWMPGCWAF